MNRCCIAVLTALLAICVPHASRAAESISSSTSGKPLNVLLIVSDDHRADALGCAGNSIVKTPTLDQLARTGVRFTHAFCEVPICTPSRASYQTGRFAASNGVSFFGMPLLENTPTWAGTLAERGYETAITGKWHNMRSFQEYGYHRAANVFEAGMGDYLNPRLIPRAGEKPKVIQGEITQLITDAAVEYLSQDHDKPFFLYVAYTAPHDPRTPPTEYERMYDPAKIPLPANFRPMPEPDPGTLEIRDEKLLPLPRDPAAVRREIAKYYGLITYMDHQVGRILETLEKRGLAENTIVMFAGDNGLAIGSHGLLGKQTLHEEGVRVPMILRHPRMSVRGETRDAMVYLTDMMPTAMEWTGTPIPAGVQGRSLADVYAGEATAVRDCVFGRYDERGVQMFRSIRTERYKLLQYIQQDREQLFDLVNDPFEMKDLSTDASLQSVRQQLRERLMEWRREQDRIESTYSKPWDKSSEKGSKQ